jgi:broad specificity phosphatase PhoE
MSSKRLIDIYLCRHGTTTWNLKGLWQGLKDTRLASEGIEQARSQASTFTKSNIQPEKIVASPLLRAKETAMILSKGLGLNKSIELDDRLKECYLGEFEGMHRDTIYGPKYKYIFNRLRKLPQEKRIRTTYFDDLETPKEISDRVVECILDTTTETAALAKKPQKCMMYVSHSVILKSVLSTVFNKYYEGIQMETLAWIHMRVDLETKKLSLCQVDGIEFDVHKEEEEEEEEV